jgi:glycosyl transferase family 25
MNPFPAQRIQAVYVIHARKYVERGNHMRAHLAQFGIPFEIIETFDADHISEADLKRYVSPESKLSPALVSSVFKHIEALRRMVASDVQRALIFEDDVVLHPQFNEHLNRFLDEADRFDHAYSIQIGCANNMFVPKRLLQPSQHLYPADQVRAADSFIVNHEAARLRLEWLERNKFFEPADHLYNRTDREMGIRFYWSDPTIVEQGSMNGMFQSTLCDKRSRMQLWQMKWKFTLQRWRKKYIRRYFQ